MTLDSAGTLPSGPASSDMHAVSHPDPVHGARPGINETETYATGSQDSNATNSTDPSITKPASNYAALNGASLSAPETQAPDLRPSQFQGSHLDHLSAIAAAQDKMMTDQGREHGDQALFTGGLAGGASKRTADGELKQPRGSMSPVKGHSRNTSTMSAVSTVSMASTTTSTIGDLSSDLKTRLSYAMLKVQNGWQSNSLDEVESMASQAASPTSSTSTIHRHKDASASPRVNLPSTAVQYPQPPSQDESRNRTKTNSPPARASSNGRGLAPPAPIRPSAGHVPNKRRHSNARNPPKLNTLGYAGSPHTPAQPSPLLASHMRQPDRPNLSPHQNVREQDAIETLLFMSSPGNSANMKHAFSPSGSPGPVFPNQGNAATRHALPSGPRKALPMQRPGHGEKKIGFVNSPLTSQPQSPMDLDSPYASPNQAAGASRRRVNGASSHLRGALSLPSGLGASSLGSPRRTIDDAYVENMLERAAAESSDEDEIQLPPRRPAETLA